MKVSRLPASAKVVLIPIARNTRPSLDACIAEPATAGITGSTHGDSKLKIPAKNASGMEEISTI